MGNNQLFNHMRGTGLGSKTRGDVCSRDILGWRWSGERRSNQARQGRHMPYL